MFFLWNQLYEKEAPTQVLSYEYFEIFKSSFFYRTPPVAAYDEGPIVFLFLDLDIYNPFSKDLVNKSRKKTASNFFHVTLIYSLNWRLYDRDLRHERVQAKSF